MWRRVKYMVNELARERPGERFTRYYKRHRQDGKRSRTARTLYSVLGWTLTAVGLVFTLLPVLPGFVLIVPGLAIVAVQSNWAARALDRLEVAVRRVTARVRKRRA